MVTDFFRDLKNAKKGEETVLNTFSSLTDDYTFEDVSNLREYYYRGDICATEKSTGRRIFIEVKQDGCISSTKNVLCEEEVLFYDSGEFKKGNMHSNYDIYCVVSPQLRTIYVIDFATLRKYYKNGTYKVIEHPEQVTFCYLLSLNTIKEFGGLIAAISY